MKISTEMNFCRRCGNKFTEQNKHVYKCPLGHVIFLNSSPAVGVVLFNDKNEVILLERAIDPGKGWLDIPGGFCDDQETLEDAIAREIREEVGLRRSQYGEIEFVSSQFDPYPYGGEVIPVLGIMFRAKLRPDVMPIAADDAASVQFVPLKEIDLGKVYFPSIRAALQKLRG